MFLDGVDVGAATLFSVDYHGVPAAVFGGVQEVVSIDLVAQSSRNSENSRSMSSLVARGGNRLIAPDTVRDAQSIRVAGAYHRQALEPAMFGDICMEQGLTDTMKWRQECSPWESSLIARHKYLSRSAIDLQGDDSWKIYPL